MPNPRLLHPIPVKIRQKDTSTTVYDKNYREPIGQVRRPQKPIELLAQHMVRQEKMASPEETGMQEQSDGYLLFDLDELRRKKITVGRGDRIVEMGTATNARAVDFYVIKLQFIAHYPDIRGPGLVKAFYQDRQPANLRV